MDLLGVMCLLGRLAAEKAQGTAECSSNVRRTFDKCVFKTNNQPT